MSWVVLEDSMVLPAASQERLTVVKIKGTDDLPDILEECVETFRGAIRSSGQPLGPDGTIPLQLKQYVLDRTIWLFVTRGMVKNAALQTSAREKASERSEDVLGKIISQELKVIGDDPDQTISHGVSAPRPGVRVRPGGFEKMGAS